MLTLFNVISSDGFIARLDGGEDFIPSDLWQNFLDLCEEYGTLMMGRKTYDTIQGYEKDLILSFEALSIKKIVISSNHSFCPKNGYTVVHSPADAVEMAPNSLVSSGPTLNNFLLQHELVGKVIIHKVPAVIGEGIKPFDDVVISLVPAGGSLQLEGVQAYEYAVQYLKK